MSLRRVLDDTARVSAARLTVLFGGLLAVNGLVWLWAWTAFAGRPALLGTALLAWVFGLRHALDADHIAAIDNVVRKLMQDGRRPVLVGSFFSLGHSAVVVLAVAVLAAGATALQQRLSWLPAVGGTVGTLVSASFLLAVALLNMTILMGLWRHLRGPAAGTHEDPAGVQSLLLGPGLLNRLLRPLMRAITRSWHMFLLGMLFGLGFDTATEVGLLALSATQAVEGLTAWQIMVFPTLFTVAMVLVDSADSVLMVGAYGWALHKPLRKFWYNLTMTAVTVVIALLIGGIEAVGLLAGHFHRQGGAWSELSAISEHLPGLGFLMVVALLGIWAASVGLSRRRRAAVR